MADNKRTHAILIREGTLLPDDLGIETELFLPGWRVVTNRDRYALSRQIEHANWNFFFLAGAIKTTVLGRDNVGTLRRAAKSLLAKLERQIPNCLEITEVVSKRFLGVPFMSVAAHSRHIQESRFLVPAKDSVFGMRATGRGPAQVDRPDAVVTKGYVTSVSSS